MVTENKTDFVLQFVDKWDKQTNYGEDDSVLEEWERTIDKVIERSKGEKMLPIDTEKFSCFIEESNIFGLTQDAMEKYLENWYSEEPEQFIADMRADVKTVMNHYQFCNSKVSFDKNLNFEPVLDTITCTIVVNDEKGDYCMLYKTIFDYEMNIVDDVLCL